MTHTITPTPAVSEPEAEWETKFRQRGRMPDADRDTAHDPRYLAARLHHALAKSAARADDYQRTNNPPFDVRDKLELNFLREAVEALTADLRSWTPEADEFEATLKARVEPSVNWCRTRYGFHGWISEWEMGAVDACVVARRAAVELRLPEVDSDKDHEWQGVIEGWSVDLRCAKAASNEARDE